MALESGDGICLRLLVECYLRVNHEVHEGHEGLAVVAAAARPGMAYHFRVRAAIVIIGDEILSGRTKETNSVELLKRLRRLGVEVVRMAIVRDRPSEIVEELDRCRRVADAVITSGGLGPTHDDVTIAAVAEVLERPVIRDPQLIHLIESWGGGRFAGHEAALRMANVPEGAELLWGDDGFLPILRCESFFLLPGVPEIFEAKIDTLAEHLGGKPRVLRRVFLSCFESDIADPVAALQERHQTVSVGSYPKLRGDYRVMISLESITDDLADSALDDLLDILPSSAILRHDRGDD